MLRPAFLTVLMACSRPTHEASDAADVGKLGEAADVVTTIPAADVAVAPTVSVNVLAGPRWHCEVPSEGIAVDIAATSERGVLRVDRKGTHRRYVVETTNDGPNVYLAFAGYDVGDVKPVGEALAARSDLGCIRTGNANWRVPGPPWTFTTSCNSSSKGETFSCNCTTVGR